jgi:hypothetical protein
MAELILWKQITAELNGHIVTGLYSASREGLVTVRTRRFTVLRIAGPGI